MRLDIYHNLMKIRSTFQLVVIYLESQLKILQTYHSSINQQKFS